MFPYEQARIDQQDAVERAAQGQLPLTYGLDVIPAIPSSGVSVFSGFRKSHGSLLREHFEAQDQERREPARFVSFAQAEHLAQFKSIFRR